MRLPAVAIVAAFASGIALGLHPLVAPQVASRFFLAACLAASLVLILAGLALAKMDLLLLPPPFRSLAGPSLVFLELASPNSGGQRIRLLLFWSKSASRWSLRCAGAAACVTNLQNCPGATVLKLICPELSSRAQLFLHKVACV